MVLRGLFGTPLLCPLSTRFMDDPIWEIRIPESSHDTLITTWKNGLMEDAAAADAVSSSSRLLWTKLLLKFNWISSSLIPHAVPTGHQISEQLISFIYTQNPKFIWNFFFHCDTKYMKVCKIYGCIVMMVFVKKCHHLSTAFFSKLTSSSWKKGEKL